jgi:hypothetical protein
MRRDKFHGRYDSEGRSCEYPGCREAGEFRAPGHAGNSFNGPGNWRWFCLDHVREFNQGYDWFDGMTADEILEAQSPTAGWRTESPAFRPTAGADTMPRWADFADPLDAISARANRIRGAAQRRADASAAESGTSRRFNREETRALETLGLGADTDRQGLRRRYSELVRRYHPDRNGGDRRHEDRLQQVVEAYALLKGSRAFA